jgi:hypothetical protein
MTWNSLAVGVRVLSAPRGKKVGAGVQVQGKQLASGIDSGISCER